MLAASATQFGSSDGLLLFSEILFSSLWLVGLVVVALTGATALRLGTYLGATIYAFLWDWIQGQGWFFRTTFDDRLIPAFVLDGREEPLFAPLAYGLVFGTLAVVGLTMYPTLYRKIGNWTYVVFGLVGGVLDILVEGGVAITLLHMYVMDYDDSWKILNLPWIVPIYVGLLSAALLFTVVTLSKLVEAGRAGTPEIQRSRDSAGLWFMCLIQPAGVNYLVVGALALVFNPFSPW